MPDQKDVLDENLHCWMYVSQSTLPESWAARAVDDIVRVSQRLNRDLAVTGALLFTGARFVQLIEGPGENILTLRTRILSDPRHCDIQTLLSGPWSARLFRDWSLAYAGPSLFVGEKVDALVSNSPEKAAEIILLLREFAEANLFEH